MSSFWTSLSDTVSNIAGYTTPSTIKTYAETADPSRLFTELTLADAEWTLASGSSTENQVFYITTKQGGFAFVQLIHSNIGIWSPTIQFTSRMYDPTTNTNTFKSVNMSNFTLSEDRRSVKSDNMSITLDPTCTKYKVVLKHPELFVAIEFERVDRGFKIGEGRTYFGGDAEANGTYVSHKFWPKARATGNFIIDNQQFEVEGDGMFIHAIQGMQPHLVASKWNFVDFQASDAALSMMQFQTTKQYGAVNVNQGSLTLDGVLVSVSVENTVELKDLVEDEETGYQIPKTIRYEWKGKTLDEANPEDVKVVMFVKTETLLDKIDVLNEVPYFLKKLVQTFVAKPYIYQWLDKASAEVTIGDKVIILEGKCFHELVFVSEM